MPMVDEKVLAEQIRFEAEQYIPFDINSISLSYHPIGGLKRDPLEILLVAAQNSGIQKHLELLKASGLDLKCIDVSGFALANAFELSMGRQRGEILGVLNFGASSSNFVVLRNGETLFSRDISIGGQNHTLEIHKTLGMSIEEAEAMKISVANGQEAPQEVLNAIQVVNDSLLDELKSALDFITATMDGLQVSKIYFTGGAADTPNLVRSLEQGVQVPFQRFNAFNKVTSIGKGVDKNFLQSAARFAAVAVGLGCRKLGDV
jgi:type IV pilus assembly protein PilM